MHSMSSVREGEYVSVPAQVYEAVLLELEQCRRVLDRCEDLPASAIPERRVVIGRDPVTFRLEAWLK